MRLLLHHVDPVGRKVHRIPASSIEPHFSQTRQLTTQHPAYRLSLLRACEVLTSKALPTLPVKHRTAFLRQEDINICYRREAVTHGLYRLCARALYSCPGEVYSVWQGERLDI